MALGKDNPLFWHCKLHTAVLNGITQKWADTALTAEELSGPVILFMHGWPESWFSWRHQMKAVHEAGYRGIAPYMRGYGAPSGAPTAAAEYNVYRLAGDMLAILQHIGASKCALVGHDHGANLGWTLALLHPNVFVIYIGMSVPPAPRSAHHAPPVDGMRKVFGDERNYDPNRAETNPDFFYWLHHNLPASANDYSKNTRSALMALGFGDPKDAAGPPLVESSKLFVGSNHPAMWERVPQPTKLHPWITQEEFDYYVNELEHHGWNGGLNWYRVMDLNVLATPQLLDTKLQQPCQFITGTKDMVLQMSGGREKVTKLIKKSALLPIETIFIDGAGHWVQQERPNEVNDSLLKFVRAHHSLFADGANVVRSRL